MIEQYLTIIGYWKDTKEPLERLCKVDSRMNPHHKDHQKFINSLDDDVSDVFYYFEPDENILGNHADFVVYRYNIEGVSNGINY